MKILVICQHYYPEPFRISDICEELVKRGHEVTALVGLPNYPEGTVLKEYRHGAHKDEVLRGVRVIRCYEHGRGRSSLHLIWNYFSYALSAKRKVGKLDKDFDVVFIAQLSPVMMAWPGLKYAKKYKKKSLLYCYDLWPASLSAGGIKKGSLIYKVFGKISKKIYAQADHICVTSKSFVDYFFSEHGIPQGKISYLPQYCEELFERIEPKSHEGLNYVFAGNIGKMQSVETIIRAASLIKDRKDIKIHIVGDGRDLDNCKKLAEELDTTNVIFHGRRPIEEMPDFYAMADAMIVTMAKDELVSKTLPGKLQSYMAAGKPIVAAVDGEAKAIIEEAKCGAVCDAEDYERLAELFSSLRLKADFKEWAERSREYFSCHFLKNTFFEILEKAIEQMQH